MSKYLEFKEIPFKGKTKRFEIISKTSYDMCEECEGGLQELYKDGVIPTGTSIKCKNCDGTGKKYVILGRISWYPVWRQYTFSPAFPTTWNRECMNDIISFINNLMRDRQIKMGTYKGYVSEEDYKRLKNV